MVIALLVMVLTTAGSGLALYALHPTADLLPALTVADRVPEAESPAVEL